MPSLDSFIPGSADDFSLSALFSYSAANLPLKSTLFAFFGLVSSLAAIVGDVCNSFPSVSGVIPSLRILNDSSLSFSKDLRKTFECLFAYIFLNIFIYLPFSNDSSLSFWNYSKMLTICSCCGFVKVVSETVMGDLGIVNAWNFGVLL